MVFRDRRDAGARLAARLRQYREARPILVALPRGGVCVAFEVARALGAPLDVIAAQELETPDYRECTIGAIAEGGGMCLDRKALRDAELTEEDATAIAEQQISDLARCARAYRGGRPLTDVAGQTIVLLDDGVATGAAVRAGGQVIRRRGAARMVLAAPVIAAEAAAALSVEFDDVVAVEFASVFPAVAYWYERFPEVSDDQAAALLRRARHRLHARSEAVALWGEEWLEVDTEDPPETAGPLGELGSSRRAPNDAIWPVEFLACPPLGGVPAR